MPAVIRGSGDRRWGTDSDLSLRNRVVSSANLEFAHYRADKTIRTFVFAFLSTVPPKTLRTGADS
jgi:hypothetical protein